MVLRGLCVLLIGISSTSSGIDLQRSKIKLVPSINQIQKTGSKYSSESDIKKLAIKKPIDLIVELALTSEEQEMGLMYRKSLAPGYGMLFVFSDERPRQFWMKNTLIPLSVAFLDKKKTIFQISDLNPVKTLIQKKYDRAESIKPAKYVLEVPQGWFLVNKIDVGSVMIWDQESKFNNE